MGHWLDPLREELDVRRSQHLLRSLLSVNASAPRVRRQGRELINLAGNDALALAGHPKLAEAVARAARDHGVGAGASRLICGHLEVHAALERRFAAFKHAEAALLLPTGYTANLAVLGALAGPEDLICLDKLNHASLIDAAQASGAQVRIYPHGQLEKLERLLERHADHRRRFIVTDAVFSMDGDCADLPALCALRDRYGAILLVDEAHATGILGEQGSGLAEMQQVAGYIDLTVSTASKALGGLGGLITGPSVAIESIINHARPFIYSTGVPPTQVAAIDAALDLVRDEPWRRERVLALSCRLRIALREQGWAVRDDPTPIIPLIVGESQVAVDLAGSLEEAGFLVGAVRPPTVAPGAARLRISLRCDLEDPQIDALVAAIGAPLSRP